MRLIEVTDAPLKMKAPASSALFDTQLRKLREALVAHIFRFVSFFCVLPEAFLCIILHVSSARGEWLGLSVCRTLSSVGVDLA